MLRNAPSELRIVAACCRPAGQLNQLVPNQLAANRLAAIRAAADEPFVPDYLLLQAQAHRVEALVEDGLAQVGINLPDTAARLLARRVRVARLQMLRNAGEEVRLSEQFRTSGVDAIFVKGATLAMLAHGSLARKSSWDIDLLVDRADIDQAIGVLRAAGYEFDHPAVPGLAMEHRFAARVRESSWTNRERRTTVELHWALASNPALLTGIGMTSARQTIMIADHAAVTTLKTPDLFAFLAVHGTAHGWSRLKWLADIAALADSTPDLLPDLLHHAGRVNAGRCTAVALCLMRDVLGVSIPAHLNAEIALDRHVPALVDYSVRTMQASVDATDDIDHRLSKWWELHWYQMSMAPGFRNGFADIWAKLNQPVIPSGLRLPTWLLVPHALLIWLPGSLLRRLVMKLQSGRSGNMANTP